MAAFWCKSDPIHHAQDFSLCQAGFLHIKLFNVLEKKETDLWIKFKAKEICFLYIFSLWIAEEEGRLLKRTQTKDVREWKGLNFDKTKCVFAF